MGQNPSMFIHREKKKKSQRIQNNRKINRTSLMRTTKDRKYKVLANVTGLIGRTALQR